jgi:hypothetical protein
MSIFHYKRRRFFAMVEATPGTPIVAASLFVLGNGKIPVYNLKCVPGVQNMDRNPDGSTFDSIDSVRWGDFFTITFQTDAYCGTGLGVPPSYALLYKSCAMGETIVASTSTTYTVDSDACPTISIGVEQIDDTGAIDKRIIAGGCLGTFVTASDAIGKPGRTSWTFIGKSAYVSSVLQDLDGTTVASVIYDDSTTKLPQLRETTITDGGVSVQANAFSFDRGLTTEWETDLADPTGYKKRIVASSNPKLTIDPAKMPVATQATLSQLFQGTTGAVNVTIGKAAGNRIKYNLTRAQKESLSDDARGVTSTYGTTYRSNRSSLTGNGDDAANIVFD